MTTTSPETGFPVDAELFPADGPVPIEQSQVHAMCAAVENANPVFWDDTVAAAITGGPVAPPTMLSAWCRPDHWTPGASEPHVALQMHFELKERFDLPESVVAANTLVLHEPVRPGDRLRTVQVLRSIGDVKETRLGTGRFWVIDVRYRNQRDELVGVDSYTMFAYRTPSGGAS